MDTLTSKERSHIMSLVKAKDTKPEMVVRRLIHAMGYRYRLHDRTLPGCPDLVFKSHRKVIFVSGCFWHRHHCPNGTRMPKTRIAFWRKKLEGNKARDTKNIRELRQQGWKVLVIWECSIHNPQKLTNLLKRFFCN